MAEIVNGATATIAVEDSVPVEKKGSPVKRKSEADGESPIKKVVKRDDIMEPQQVDVQVPIATEKEVVETTSEQCDESDATKPVDDAAAAGDKKEEPQEPETCDMPKSDAESVSTEVAKADAVPDEGSVAKSADQPPPVSETEAEATA